MPPDHRTFLSGAVDLQCAVAVDRRTHGFGQLRGSVIGRELQHDAPAPLLLRQELVDEFVDATGQASRAMLAARPPEFVPACAPRGPACLAGARRIPPAGPRGVGLAQPDRTDQCEQGEQYAENAQPEPSLYKRNHHEAAIDRDGHGDRGGVTRLTCWRPGTQREVHRAAGLRSAPHPDLSARQFARCSPPPMTYPVAARPNPFRGAHRERLRVCACVRVDRL